VGTGGIEDTRRLFAGFVLGDIVEAPDGQAPRPLLSVPRIQEIRRIMARFADSAMIAALRHRN